jgi:hypothetical protein
MYGDGVVCCIASGTAGEHRYPVALLVSRHKQFKRADEKGFRRGDRWTQRIRPLRCSGAVQDSYPGQAVLAPSNHSYRHMVVWIQYKPFAPCRQATTLQLASTPGAAAQVPAAPQRGDGKIIANVNDLWVRWQAAHVACVVWASGLQSAGAEHRLQRRICEPWSAPPERSRPRNNHTQPHHLRFHTCSCAGTVGQLPPCWWCT